MPRTCSRLALALSLLLTSGIHAADTKTILLVAGPRDPNHPPGTHEYEQSARLLKYALETSPNLRGVRPVVVTNGWPADPALLAEASSIVLITSGADRKVADHPLLAGDRLAVLEKEMRRGCGLVAIHWTVFVPNAGAGDKLLDWIGGYFDYQSGRQPPPQPSPSGGGGRNSWAGDVKDITTTLVPASATHPILRGVEAFRIREELYYGLRFRPKDPRLTPILQADFPGAGEQTVAWAVERTDGGRGFGFTGGHYFANWRVPAFRRTLLNAIAWSAKLDVPPGGVDSTIPSGDVPAGDPAWTPRPTAGSNQPWEMANEQDWVDGRLRVMDTGPAFNATYTYPSQRGSVWDYKGMAIKVGDGGVLFDRARLRLAAGWTGGWIRHSDKRFGFLNTPTPIGQMIFTTGDSAGWASTAGGWTPSVTAMTPLPREWAKFRGHYLHGSHVVLSYTVGGVGVLDTVSNESGDGSPMIARTLELAPTKEAMTLQVCQLLPGNRKSGVVDGVRLAAVQNQTISTAAALVGPDDLALNLDESAHATVTIPPSDKVRRLKLLMWRCPSAEMPAMLSRAKASAAPADLSAWTKPGPARWGAPIETKGQLGANDGPLALDTLTVPYDNPFRALMFLTAIDFMPNGDAAVCTAHGDVWLVSGIDQNLDKLRWKRFATGLFQPMGLKVVDGQIVVLERGQLTRLHDTNGDGEADFYECLCNDWYTGPGEHSYDTCLETDAQGNFYFFKTGDTDTPTGGCLLRVSKDGAKLEIFATGVRHPIGLGMGPNGMLTGADQEGNYMPATRVDAYRPGGFYGDLRAHHRSVQPKIYDPAMVWLPREADPSAGGQAWAPSGQWGPHGGECLHFSWGRCRLLRLYREQVEGQWQGAAIDLGLFFLSGSKCGRFNPKDNNLYVVGLNGWQTAARRDGCLQRVRATGQPFRTLSDWQTTKTGVKLSFSVPVDAAAAGDPARWTVNAWNYVWSADYGSKHWSVADPSKQGEDTWPVERAEVSSDGMSVTLAIRGWRPVMSVRVKYALPAADGGAPLAGTIWGTVNRVAAK